MRISARVLAIGIALNALAISASAAEPPAFGNASGQAPTWEQLQYKKLHDQDALDKLQHSNPRHYAIARRILAAANEICDAGNGTLIQAKFDAKYVVCAQSLWLASNPPKRVMEFRLDDTVYSTLVVVTDMHARLDRIH